MDKEKSIYTAEEQALIDGVEFILDYSEVPDEEDYQEYLRLIERGRQAEALAEKEKFEEQRKDKNYVPIPDYAKVGEVFKTRERFLLVMNNGTLMPLENGSDETIALWRQKLKNLGKEVELNLELGNFSKEQVDYTYDCPLPEGVNHTTKRRGR